jgi:predicted HTH domain antitoxin
MPIPYRRHTGKLRLPDDPPEAFVLEHEPLTKAEAPVWRELRIMLAAKLYGAGRVSSERAAKLAGSPHIEFLLTLGFYKVFPLMEELVELEKEAHGTDDQESRL